MTEPTMTPEQFVTYCADIAPNDPGEPAAMHQLGCDLVALAAKGEPFARHIVGLVHEWATSTRRTAR